MGTGWGTVSNTENNLILFCSLLVHKAYESRGRIRLKAEDGGRAPKSDTLLRVYHAVDTIPGEAVELHEVVDLLLGGSEQGRVRGVLGAAALKMVHRQL